MKLTLNIKLITKIYGFIGLLIGVAMLPPAVTAFLYHETHIGKTFICTAAAVAFVSLVCILGVKPKKHHLKTRDGFFIVGVGWIIVILIGCIPYLASGYTHSFCSAFFESTAGFTTTGATVLFADDTPKAFLMWKAISHWLGGMGILVFTVSLLPALGAGGHKIFRAEVPALSMDKIVSKISDSAKILYLMYIGFTVLEFILLALSGMDVFDNIICTLGCVSTAGLVSHSIGPSYFNNLYVEIIVLLFTVFASINFSLYTLAAKGNFKEIRRDTELRTFLSLLIISSLMISACLYFTGTYSTIGDSIRYGFFQAASFSSTTGYALTDYSMWPPFCIAILFMLMLVGGCAASTCGSVKVIRVIVAFKLVVRSIYRRIHPRAIVSVKVGGKTVSAEVAAQITSFLLTFFVILLIGTLILSLQGFDFLTNISAAASVMSNTGIFFGDAGASGNFSIFLPPLQLVLALLMVIGRLEIFTLLVLLSPSFWHPDRAID